MIAHLDWRDRAACRGVDPDLFFGPDDDETGETGAARELRERAARTVCARCPVTGPCRDLAITTHDVWSVSGGLNYTGRVNYKRRMRARKARAA